MTQIEAGTDQQAAPIKPKTQVMGILSIIMFGLTLCVLLVGFGLVALAYTPTRGAGEGAGNAFLIGGSLLIVSAVPILIGNLIGCVFGIIGLVQKNRRKGLAIVGTTLNGILLLVYLALFLVLTFNVNRW